MKCAEEVMVLDVDVVADVAAVKRRRVPAAAAADAGLRMPR